MGNERVQRASKEQVEYLGTWLGNAKEISDAVPIVRQAYDYAVAQYQAFSAAPSGLSTSQFDGVAHMIEQNNAYLKAKMPLPGSVDLAACSSGYAMVASAGTAAIPQLSQFTTAQDSSVKGWANESLNRFTHLNVQASNISFILQWLKATWPSVALEFQDAITTCDHARSATADYPSAAFAMRNVLESLNGYVLDLARKRAGAGTVKKWGDAAGYIAKGAPSSPETVRLVAEATTYSTLWEQLTKVGKRDLRVTGFDLEAMYATFVGLLFTACSLIDAP